MIDRLIFEDSIGSVHFSAADNTFFGKLEGINDLVTFEGSSVSELKKSFRAAVKDIRLYVNKLEKMPASHLKVHLTYELIRSFMNLPTSKLKKKGLV